MTASVIFNAIRAHCALEMDLQEFFDGDDIEEWKRKDFKLQFHHQTYDDYDGSIEIYLRGDTVFDEQKLMEFLKVRGFPFGWINFSDGTEQHFGTSCCSPRKPVSHPRWSKELEDKDLTPATFINYQTREIRNPRYKILDKFRESDISTSQA